MNTINNNTLSFKGIIVQRDKEHLIKQEFGEQALDILENAMETHSDYFWKLNVNGDKCTLRSPSTRKTYEGPFTVKKHLKLTDKSAKPQLIVRLDKTCRVKYAVDFPSAKDVYNAYKEIKNSNGIVKVLKIFELLERNYIDKQRRLLKRL